MLLVAYLENYSFRNISTPFVVSESSGKITCLPSTDQTYLYGSPPLSFNVGYKNETFAYGLTLTQTSSPVSVDTSGNIGPTPGFIKFKSTTQTFTVSDVALTDFNSYTIGLQLGYAEYPSFSVVCSVPLKITYKPVFKGDPLSS